MWLPLNGIEIPTNESSVNDSNAKKFDVDKGHVSHIETCERYAANARKHNASHVEMVLSVRTPQAKHDPGDESDSSNDQTSTTNGDPLQQPAETETSAADTTTESNASG
jgi:hypothetical protein